MRKLFLIIAILSFNTLLGQDSIYSNNKSFSFKPIASWENNSKENILIFAQPFKSKIDNYQENIHISEYPANGMTLEELWQAFVLRDFPISFENYKFIQMAESKVNFKKAKWIEFTNTDNKVEFKNLVYMFVENDKMYYIICLATESEYEATEKDFRQMINSFEIK